MKYKFLAIISFLIVFVSCGEDEVQNFAFTSDAYVRGMYVNGKVSYAPVLLAVANQEASGIAAVDSKKNKYILVNYWNDKNKFRWVPEEANFTPDFQAKETYTFVYSEKNDKKQEQAKTVSLTDVPKAFEIKELTYDKKKDTLNISWTNAEADYYLIQIAQKIDESPLFQSVNFPEPTEENVTVLKTEITRTSFKWFGTPKKDDKYQLIIHAFNYVNEEDITGEFVVSKEFIWGKN